MKRFHQDVNLPRCVYSVKKMTEIKAVGEWVNNNVEGSSSLAGTTCEFNVISKLRDYIMITKLIERGKIFIKY